MRTSNSMHLPGIGAHSRVVACEKASRGASSGVIESDFVEPSGRSGPAGRPRRKQGLGFLQRPAACRGCHKLPSAYDVDLAQDLGRDCASAWAWHPNSWHLSGSHRVPAYQSTSTRTLSGQLYLTTCTWFCCSCGVLLEDSLCTRRLPATRRFLAQGFPSMGAAMSDTWSAPSFSCSAGSRHRLHVLPKTRPVPLACAPL